MSNSLSGVDLSVRVFNKSTRLRCSFAVFMLFASSIAVGMYCSNPGAVFTISALIALVSILYLLIKFFNHNQQSLINVNVVDIKSSSIKECPVKQVDTQKMHTQPPPPPPLPINFFAPKVKNSTNKVSYQRKTDNSTRLALEPAILKAKKAELKKVEPFQPYKSDTTSTKTQGGVSVSDILIKAMQKRRNMNGFDSSYGSSYDSSESSEWDEDMETQPPSDTTERSPSSQLHVDSTFDSKCSYIMH